MSFIWVAIMDSLNSYAVFVQAAETRSFVATGRHFGISASAVGKSIARMEQRLGVRLFHRSTRSITLTSDGAMLLERSRRILGEVEAMEQELSQRTQAPRGRLRVSLPVVSNLILPALSDFMAGYPEIELDLDFSDRLVDVIDEGFDAVVRTGEPTDSRLSARQLGSFRQYLVGAPDYFERHGVPQRPEDLAAHRCMHYRFAHSGKLEFWPLRTQDGGAPELPVSMCCNNIETRLCFALRGRGIAYLPEFAVREALRDGHLQSVLDDFLDERHRITLRVLWPSGGPLSPKLRAFVDFLSARTFPEPMRG